MQTLSDKDYIPDNMPEEEEFLVNSEEISLEVEELNDSNEPVTIQNYKKKLKKNKVNMKVETIQEQVCTKQFTFLHLLFYIIKLWCILIYSFSDCT